MDAKQRNQLAKQYILDKLGVVAQHDELYYSTIPRYAELQIILNNLINVQAMGFRGVVATALTGMHLDPAYNPLTNFYDCNPRSIFEQGIFYAFEGRIPCGKSDPLNVAKNTYVLDDNWADGKRPQTAAQAAVDYLRLLESCTTECREHTINYFFFKLNEYAKSITSIQTIVPRLQSLSNQVFAERLIRFSLEYPESGTTPQLVISKIMNKHFAHSVEEVLGGDESVFGTNTTSKKPADIWLELNDVVNNLFEVTVKKIDFKRLDDCIQSLNSLKLAHLPVNFICRIPEDINTLVPAHPRHLFYKNVQFHFYDISEFIRIYAITFTLDQMNEIISELEEFVSRIERPVSTKHGWNTIFG